MKYVAAYLLATLGGDASPSASKLESILGIFKFIINFFFNFTFYSLEFVE